MASKPTAGRRKRASSVKEAINDIETDPAHHLTGPFVNSRPTPPSEGGVLVAEKNGHVRNGVSPKKRAEAGLPQPDFLANGLWSDITSLNWARVPTSALFLMFIPMVLYLQWQIISPNAANPFRYLLMIQYPVSSTSDPAMYQKGYGDLAFLAYYIVVFCFIRQSLTIYFLRPLGWKLGVKNEAKLDRFAEQGYAVIYMSTSGALGLWAMYHSPTWYFQGRHYFQDYPYWKMTKFMKSYYLLQFSYWLQQFLILVLRLEKPRKDFKELVAHHIVTLWLIGCSYLVNLTPIGNAVFITMDVSDIFLAFVKILNYLKLEKASVVAFGWLVLVWSYTRHYLNLRILWDIYNDFELIPKWAQQWAPETGAWLVPWMKWQIFVPLALLQALNLFWYLLIWRILLRALFKKELADERSDDEDDGQPDEQNDKDD
ncbi:hypothetical protein M407DRAFT_18228 [Tulasnella calospora MUT 4182]|uniref:TLC domain-containing protein n=1 Tax=Tulasnella calospora MUT 4182 TaxID=1051891 RepID=A0A0C3LFQ2_9AGAM|nr:hypothetical protein M407DRAFT_18228 [Tulasnella calospora MUT 4182]